ncbi:MAG: sugar phosphate isomerase/epimerase [Dehalococcoidia bacterium]|nr:sugar phosphate isomerase/epimerase [Dehalococcoidia bacterium]
MFDISACAWCLTTPAPQSVSRLRSAGFDLIDLRPDCWDGIRDKAHLAELGVRVSCCGITPVTMAPGFSLDTLATADAGRAIPYYIGAIQRAAALGAMWVYMVTPQQRSGESPIYVRSVARLADEAARVGVKLCIEPHPGRALSNYSEVMRFLDAARSTNLYALLDLGHLPLSGEDIPATVRMLGDRIGYVHVDDNDGKSDRHFGLLEGVITPALLDAFLHALAATPYRGPLAIELNKTLPSPVSSLGSSRDFLMGWSERRGV